MKKTLQYTTICALAAFAPFASAEPLDFGHLSSEANWFLHADLTELKTTKTGSTVAAAIQEEHGPKIKAVKRMFSINPLEDLRGLTIYGDGKKDRAVVLIHGKFDQAHLEDLISAADDYSSSKHGGKTIHTWTDKEKTQHGSFASSSRLVMSEQKGLVKHALDVLDGSQSAMTRPATYTESTSAPILLGLANLDGMEVKGEEAELFKKAKSIQVRIGEEGEDVIASIALEASNPQQGKRFHKVMEGLVAFAELAHPGFSKLDLTTQVVSNGAMVEASVSIPADQFLAVLKELGKMDKK